MTTFLFVRFIVFKFWIEHRAAFVSLSLSTVLACVGLTAIFVAVAEQSQVATELAELRAQRPASLRSVVEKAQVPTLPAFSGREIVETLGTIAKDVGFPMEEVTYVLDSGSDQPYRRYRINMSVTTGYPQLRHFIAALASTLPNVSLDSIRCGREGAADPALACELAFSAFFRRDDRE